MLIKPEIEIVNEGYVLLTLYDRVCLLLIEL